MTTVQATKVRGPGESSTLQALALHKWLEEEGARPTHFVVEWPDLRENRGRDPTHLAYLFATAGAMTLAVNLPREEIQPRDWKGGVPKEIMLRRIETGLTEREQLLYGELVGLVGVEGASHSLDAVGLAKWYWRTKLSWR